MSNYSKTTNFTAKDALTTGDPNKVIKGSEHDTEYDNIATASATKSNKIISGTTNNVIKQSAGGDLVDSGYSFSGLVGDTAVTKAEIDVLDGITATTAELNIMDSVTATTAEINVLDGIPAGLTATELGYVNGVTSAIQTQIDAKATTSYIDAAIDDLSGVTDDATARTNLGLGDLAVLDTVPEELIDGYTTGAYILISADTEQTSSIGLTSYTKVKEIDVAINGTYSIYFELRTPNPAGPAYGRIYVNGIAVGTERSTSSTAYVAYAEDIVITSHDLVQLYYHTTGANTALIKNFRIRYGVGNGLTNTVVLD